MGSIIPGEALSRLNDSIPWSEIGSCTAEERAWFDLKRLFGEEEVPIQVTQQTGGPSTALCAYPNNSEASSVVAQPMDEDLPRASSPKASPPSRSPLNNETVVNKRALRGLQVQGKGPTSDKARPEKPNTRKRKRVDLEDSTTCRKLPTLPEAPTNQSGDSLSDPIDVDRFCSAWDPQEKTKTVVRPSQTALWSFN